MAAIHQRCRQRQTGPRPRRHCVRWESSSPKESSTTARTFRPTSIVAKRSPISASAELLLASTKNGSQSRFVHKSKVIHPHLPSVVSRSFVAPVTRLPIASHLHNLVSLHSLSTLASCLLRPLFVYLRLGSLRRLSGPVVRTLTRGSMLKLECGPMSNLMVALPNIGGALCSTPQILANAHY